MTDQNERAPLRQTPPPIPSEDELTGTPSNIVTTLLKAPMRVSGMIARQEELVRQGLILLGAAMVCYAIFGFAMGTFGGLPVARMDVVKAPLVALCSLLLCFPSLYVFACVGGSPLSLSQTFMLGCSCLAMIGLLLVGLAPVAWLFSASTQSIPFMVVLSLFIWFISVAFAARFVGKLKATPLFQRSAGITWWFLILILVTLQMATCMRPMLAKPAKGQRWWTDEKEFFLSHFSSTLEPRK